MEHIIREYKEQDRDRLKRKATMNKTLNEFEKTIGEISKLKNVENDRLLDPIQEGKWSIREIVGHLYYWDKHNLESMVAKMTDGANLPPFPDHDQQNEEAIAYLNGESVNAIINSFIAMRKELIESISKVEDNTRFTIGKGKRKFSAESFIKIFVKHDVYHLQQINKKIGCLAEDNSMGKNYGK
ncbi:DinB family protein [Virgibacillus oceani]